MGEATRKRDGQAPTERVPHHVESFRFPLLPIVVAAAAAQSVTTTNRAGQHVEDLSDVQLLIVVDMLGVGRVRPAPPEIIKQQHATIPFVHQRGGEVRQGDARRRDARQQEHALVGGRRGGRRVGKAGGGGPWGRGAGGGLFGVRG